MLFSQRCTTNPKKLKHIVDQCKKCKDNNSNSGCSRKDTKHFNELDKILVCAVSTKFTLDTCDDSKTKENPEETEEDVEPFDENKVEIGEFSPTVV